jgi:hypothetical protein
MSAARPWLRYGFTFPRSCAVVAVQTLCAPALGGQRGRVRDPNGSQQVSCVTGHVRKYSVNCTVRECKPATRCLEGTLWRWREGAGCGLTCCLASEVTPRAGPLRAVPVRWAPRAPAPPRRASSSCSSVVPPTDKGPQRISQPALAMQPDGSALAPMSAAGTGCQDPAGVAPCTDVGGKMCPEPA